MQSVLTIQPPAVASYINKPITDHFLTSCNLFILLFVASSNSPGFGHATRVVQIASEILSLSRSHTTYIISNAPRFIFQSAIDLGAQYRHALIDAGVQQPLPYTVDRERTIKDLTEFLEKREEMLEIEVNWLKEVKADIVLSDAPFLPW